MELPVDPGLVRIGALAELDHVRSLTGRLAPEDWNRRSAVEAWSIGEVVVHLDLFLATYSRFLERILNGHGSGTVAKTVGWISGSAIPAASPVFNAVNGALPRLVAALLPQHRVAETLAGGLANTRRQLQRTSAGDLSRPIYYEGGPYPLWFYLAIIMNELAMHAWDIESRIEQWPELGAYARVILPWFYWSASALMLRPPRATTGTIQVALSDTHSTMWWSVGAGSITKGRGVAADADVEIRGPSAPYLLAISGRLKLTRVSGSSLVYKGDRDLAERFLASWRLI
jgi:Mycothiol maleylpyruvate isomerase N-terminal domain